MLKIFGDPEIALENIDAFAKKGGSKDKTLIPSKYKIEKEIEDTKKFGASIIMSCDELYPKLLLQTSDFPPVLILKGNKELLNKNKFSIVGTRNASINSNKLSNNN